MLFVVVAVAVPVPAGAGAVGYLSFLSVLMDEGNGQVNVSKHNLFFADGNILKCKTFNPFTHIYMFDIGMCAPATSRFYLCVREWFCFLVGYIVF